MQIGISILLSFAVFKLRLSDDVPAQSDSIPLINIYFTLCISFSLASMIWFSIIEYLKSKNKLSNVTRNFILKYLCKLISPDQFVKSSFFNFSIYLISLNLIFIYRKSKFK